MQDILKLAREFDSRADFLMVYIAEAHAADEWPVGNPIRYNQPKILSQRLKIAQDFVNEFGLSDEIPLVVDDMRSGEGELCAAQHDNPVDAAYAMWPTRFYVVQGAAVQFKAEPTKEHEYKLEHLAAFLRGRLDEPAPAIEDVTCEE